jgi:ABC-2 type transport system permease protein
VNRQVLQAITQKSQSDAATVQDDLALARTTATALREALERGDSAAARENQRDLITRLDSLDQTVGVSAALLAGVAQTLGSSSGQPDSLDVEAILANLAGARQDAAGLADIREDCSTCAAQVDRAREVELEIDDLQRLLTEFENIDAAVLISPFNAEAQSIARVPPRVTDYFAPAVLVLLLQHLAVTFAALSIVRERRLGTMDLFRISPLSTTEALLGKYLSYMLFGGVLAAVLTGLIVYLIGVPMLGNWTQYGLVIAALLFASLGIGFVISLFAQTDSQAVQYSMLVLLTSVFFSGLFISQHLLWAPIRVISWMLPVTYGMTLLHGVMLRGVSLNWILWLGMMAIGLFLIVLAWLRMQRLMARQ